MEQTWLSYHLVQRSFKDDELISIVIVVRDSLAWLLIWLDYLQSLNGPLPSDSPSAGTGSWHGFLLLISPSLVTYKTGRVIGQASEDNSITLSYFSRERWRLCHSVRSFWSSLGLLVVHMYIRAHGELTELWGIIKSNRSPQGQW